MTAPAARTLMLKWLVGLMSKNGTDLLNTDNVAWKDRGEIEPSYKSGPIPKVFEILKRLPKTNCRECGQTTCMVFASLVAEGAKGAEDCLPLDDSNSKKLSEYMSRFRFDL